MSSRIDVLYITYDGLLEPLGRSQVLPYVTALARDGQRMAVLSFEKSADLRDHAAVATMKQTLADAGVSWTPLRYHKTPTLLATAYDITRGTAHARRSDPRLVHARSYVAGLIGLNVKRRNGARLLFDMRGFWIDERLESGIWRAGSMAVRAARRVERSLLRDSDAIVSLTERGKQALRATPPVTVIPTCVDLRKFAPARSVKAARMHLGLPDKPLIVHAGTLSTWYLAEQTVAVGVAFARKAGGTFAILTREIEFATRLCRGIDPQPIIKSVSFDAMPDWLRAADAGLALVRPERSKQASAPTKVAEYLASGMAVAATAVGDLTEQFANQDVAFTTTADADADAIAERLLSASRLSGRAEKARSLAVQYFDLDSGVAEYANIYQTLGVMRRSQAVSA